MPGARVAASRTLLLHADPAAGDATFIATRDHRPKGNVIVRCRRRGRARPKLFIGHRELVDAGFITNPGGSGVELRNGARPDLMRRNSPR